MNENNVNANSQYSLNSIDNYKSTIDNDVKDIINKFYLLVMEYLNFITDNINYKNIACAKFIIERGYETIAHVFTHLLYYSRNLDLAYYHSQKAYYFYVEFIGQISEDKHTFLQLSSRDATMFVYKKTIFEMNNDIRKNNKELSMNNCLKLDILNLNVDICKIILCFSLNSDIKLAKKMESIVADIIKNNISKSGYNLIRTFLNYFANGNNVRIVLFEKYIDTVKIFIKKTSKITLESDFKLLESKIINKFSDAIHEEKTNESPEVFIKWLLA